MVVVSTARVAAPIVSTSVVSAVIARIIPVTGAVIVKTDPNIRTVGATGEHKRDGQYRSQGQIPSKVLHIS
jgi:hypothetical protein